MLYIYIHARIPFVGLFISPGAVASSDGAGSMPAKQGQSTGVMESLDGS